MKLLLSYISQRFKPLQFLVLAVLLSLFIYSPDSTFSEWLKGISFLFLSFLVFRFPDDAGSVQIDRKYHPERTYLESGNYRSFLILCAIVFLVYITVLILLDWNSWWHIVVVLFLQVVLYLIFNKSRIAISLIPLLKYPVLLSTLVYLPENNIPVLIAAPFVVLCYDLAEEFCDNPSLFRRLIITELIVGLLLFHHLNPLLFIVLLLCPLMLTTYIKIKDPADKGINIKTKKSSGYGYLPILLILYYPIMFFLFNH